MAEMKDSFVLMQGDNTVTIAGDVVASMAATAAAETENVTGMAAAPQLSAESADQFVRTNTKGVRIAWVAENSCRVELYITVKLGAAVREVATQVQDHVKMTVESASGLTVTGVDVYVAGISMKK